MNPKLSMLLLLPALVAGMSSRALAHCQVPCGIYNDPVRFTLLEEHVTTIEKSMQQIQALSSETPHNPNQIVRWVNNKEVHADALTEIVTYYFMAQRVKPADPADKAATAKYVKELTLLHQMVVTSMKAKQTTDLENCATLRSLLGKFRTLYLGASAQKAAPAPHVHVHAAGAAPHVHTSAAGATPHTHTH